MFGKHCGYTLIWVWCCKFGACEANDSGKKKKVKKNKRYGGTTNREELVITLHKNILPRSFNVRDF